LSETGGYHTILDNDLIASLLDSDKDDSFVEQLLFLIITQLTSFLMFGNSEVEVKREVLTVLSGEVLMSLERIEVSKRGNQFSGVMKGVVCDSLAVNQ
jgi:hypothetical protein